MLKTFIRTTACVVVSAAALIVVTKLDATAAKPRGPSVPETAEPKPAPAPSTSKLTVASVEPRAAVPVPTRDSAAAALTVPDWKGKRLSVARREARKLGLVVTAVDDDGDAVSMNEASSYRVRRQTTKAGTPVEPGANVEVHVRYIVDAAMGY